MSPFGGGRSAARLVDLAEAAVGFGASADAVLRAVHVQVGFGLRIVVGVDDRDGLPGPAGRRRQRVGAAQVGGRVAAFHARARQLGADFLLWTLRDRACRERSRVVASPRVGSWISVQRTRLSRSRADVVGRVARGVAARLGVHRACAGGWRRARARARRERKRRPTSTRRAAGASRGRAARGAPHAELGALTASMPSPSVTLPQTRSAAQLKR